MEEEHARTCRGLRRQLLPKDRQRGGEAAVGEVLSEEIVEVAQAVAARPPARAARFTRQRHRRYCAAPAAPARLCRLRRARGARHGSAEAAPLPERAPLAPLIFSQTSTERAPRARLVVAPRQPTDRFRRQVGMIAARLGTSDRLPKIRYRVGRYGVVTTSGAKEGRQLRVPTGSGGEEDSGTTSSTTAEYVDD